jgi:hypothetical protein
MGKIDWVTTITTIIGAVIGSGVANNIPFLNELIPVAGTSVGEILTMIVGGGLGGAVGGAMGQRSSV